MQQTKKELLNKLKELSNELVLDPEKIDDFTKGWTNGFHQYSFHNLVLIWFQRPDATLCAGYRQWQKVNRYVKKGSTGIAIFAPMWFKQKDTDADDDEAYLLRFRIVHVFDASQTDGEPLELGHCELVKANSELKLSDFTSKFDFEVVIDAESTVSNGHTDGKTIHVSQRPNAGSMIATFFHELTHARLKHAGNSDIPKETKELEAEASSYIICSSLGIDNQRSKYYISHWKGNKQTLGNSGSIILKTAEKILREVKNGEARI